MKVKSSSKSRLIPTLQLSGILLYVGIALAGCGTKQQAATSNEVGTAADSLAGSLDSSRVQTRELSPKEPKPTWAPVITPPMQVVMEKLASYGTPPLPTLSAPEARKQPTPTTAVLAVMKENNIPLPPAAVDTTGKSIPVTGGNIHARVYTPKTGSGPFPVIVYYHGGGWVIADLDTYHASAQGLAEQVGAVVVSVAYRQAPEHKFPTAHNDSYAAYEWVLQNAASLQGDPKRVALVGESAGGNLAAGVSMMAKQKGQVLPVYQVLVYPIAGYDTQTKSYEQYASAKPLDKPLMEWFFKQYLRSPADGNHPLISLVKVPDLKSMPPTTIINAQLDPLLSEGEMLAEKLKAAGVPVNQKTYNGVTHEFFGMATVLPEAKEAQAMAAADLKKAFTK